jgi:hypothetical protein
MKPLRVVLNREAFRDLVAGRMVALNGVAPGQPVVELVLADIGWAAIAAAVYDAAPDGPLSKDQGPLPCDH